VDYWIAPIPDVSSKIWRALEQGFTPLRLIKPTNPSCFARRILHLAERRLGGDHANIASLSQASLAHITSSISKSRVSNKILQVLYFPGSTRLVLKSFSQEMADACHYAQLWKHEIPQILYELPGYF
jgi:hypothetical protein